MSDPLHPSADDPWGMAMLALSMLAVDPGLGGVHVRARAGPVRSLFCDHTKSALGDVQNLHPSLTDDQLFGGLDLTQTLATGNLIHRDGLLERSGPRVLTMAERCPPQLAARLAITCDHRADSALILLDEGAGDDEAAPSSLRERLAFSVDLGSLRNADVITEPQSARRIARAKKMLRRVELPTGSEATMASLAQRLGIISLRGPLFALRAARVITSLDARSMVEDRDLESAVLMTLLHRATVMPTAEPEDDTRAPAEGDDALHQSSREDIPEDLILASMFANLPPDLLARLTQANRARTQGSGSGAQRQDRHRGRPLPSRPGRLSGPDRLDLVATLRAAAPCQRMLRNAGPMRLRVHARDIHTRRFQISAERLLIFAVDASGSAAAARLAEAKGAVELLLGQAYARRDHVAVVAFRGTGAETLLPPTRSLVMAKRRLSGLPGGGGTPLAAGLQQALGLSLAAQQRGMTPTVILLTDGRANIALDERADRARAGQDATAMARHLRARGIEALVIDTGQRPQPALRDLAATLDARYLALPRADSARVSQAVNTTLAG